MNNVRPSTGFVLRLNASQGFRKCLLIAFAAVAGWHFANAYRDHKAAQKVPRPMVTFSNIKDVKCHQILETENAVEIVYSCYVKKKEEE